MNSFTVKTKEKKATLKKLKIYLLKKIKNSSSMLRLRTSLLHPLESLASMSL